MFINFYSKKTAHSQLPGIFLAWAASLADRTPTQTHTSHSIPTGTSSHGDLWCITASYQGFGTNCVLGARFCDKTGRMIFVTNGVVRFRFCDELRSHKSVLWRMAMSNLDFVTSHAVAHRFCDEFHLISHKCLFQGILVEMGHSSFVILQFFTNCASWADVDSVRKFGWFSSQI